MLREQPRRTDESSDAHEVTRLGVMEHRRVLEQAVRHVLGHPPPSGAPTSRREALA